VLLIYIVKSGKGIDSDRGKKVSTYKVNDPESFEIWIFRNDQPNCDDAHIYFVTMNST
jgi:hypothetical protein